MNINHLYLLVLFICLQACSVDGPIHHYPGPQRAHTETARLQIPGPITIVEIDRKAVEVPSVENGFYDIYLLPGLHRLDFKYVLYWGDATSGMVIASDVIGIETRFNAGMTYKLTYPEPSDEHEAFEMAHKFKAEFLEMETGRQIASRSIVELNERGIRTELVSSPVVTSPDSRATNLPNSQQALSPPKGIDANTAAREDTLKRLKFWWLMANEQERDQFLDWMKSIDTADKLEKNSQN